MMVANNLPLPSRNPLPLSSTQESQVRELYYKRVRGYCANEIRGKSSCQSYSRDRIFLTSVRKVLDFASCAMNRTISVTWACRTERLTMNTCMISFATQREQDAAREEWFATRDLRLKERDEKEEKRKEQERFHNEWWGLPNSLEEADTRKR